MPVGRPVKTHIKQHYVMMHCACRYQTVRWDIVRDHKANCAKKGVMGHRPRVGYIYQVDASSYGRWTRDVGWDSSQTVTPPKEGGIFYYLCRRTTDVGPLETEGRDKGERNNAQLLIGPRLLR